MIELFRLLTADGKLQTRQRLVPPAVYLDTWAIREFAENEMLGTRFRSALLRAGGTLALSDINLIEFTMFALPKHSEAAGRFIDSVSPHLFLMKGDPTKVIERELEHLAGRLDQSPAGDEKALVQFAEAAARRGGRFNMSAWFKIIYEKRELLRGQLPAIAQTFYAQLNRLREQLASDPRSLDPVAYPRGDRSRPAADSATR
jgi:hypothetical protein